jgi:uncharacterized DUF497 family protein
MVRFEFDEAKSRANLRKHGIDFLEAQALWNDRDSLEVQANTHDEERIRIISVRRSRKSEVALYES